MSEYDEDTGDISLALSVSPTPRRATPRLLGKGLFNKAMAVNINNDDPVAGPSSLPPRPSSASPSIPTQRPGIPRSRSLQAHLDDVPHASPSRRTPSMRIGWSRRPGDPRPPPLVTPEVREKVSRWVKEIVVCNFDLERGPVVERRALGRRWGPGEKENVAFSSFPDTSLFTEGSILFSFKIRHIPPNPDTLTLPEPPSPLPDRLSPGLHIPTVEQGLLDVANKDSLTPPSPSPNVRHGAQADEYRRWDERGREWLYGFVWFEQKRDRGIARGYMQKSFVILTHLPFPSLFFALLDRAAPIFFAHGYSALEAACHSIASWPSPRPDAVVELPFMSEVLTTKLPDSAETPQVGQVFGPPWVGSNPPERPLLASMPHSTPLRSLSTVLPALWSLWECLVLAEPVLVIAPDPRTCSEIVWWLRDLLRPIPPAGDFRPYLHIHDHDFSLLVNSNKPQAGVVVGVTNPFFRNAASHWPNVISIPSDRPRVNGVMPSPKPDAPEGFLSRRHRSVQKDRVLLRRLEGVLAEGQLDDPSANEALRTHFQQLTEKMLVPLNRYFQTLVPTLSPNPAALPSTTAPPATLKPFSLPAFLAHLRTHGPNPLAFRTKGLSSKARVESDFYAAFCMSPTFAGWLHARINSLGLVQTSTTLDVTPKPPGSAKFGLGIAVAPPPLDEDEDLRQSSDSSAGFRASEESPRSASPAEFLPTRRGSEGVMRGLGGLSLKY